MYGIYLRMNSIGKEADIPWIKITNSFLSKPGISQKKKKKKKAFLFMPELAIIKFYTHGHVIIY